MDTGPALKTVYVGDRPTARHLRKGRLVVLDGPSAGRAVVIERQRVRVGRSPVCDLTLDDPSVSALHLELVATDDGLVLRDHGSTNGTWAGEVRLREALLAPRATFKAGTATLRYEPLADIVEIPLAQRETFGGVVGRSVAMREIFATLEKVAPSDLTILVEGETGTGKEVVARAIHEHSRRADRPFVVLDCTAVARTLSESQLFGHEQGAFTGAIARHKGAFEQANGGTLFLDEIGELPLDLQPKLLRVLENQEIKRVGGNRTIQVDVRLLAATNRDLRRMVADGGFREDLYFRLSVLHIELPPLRDRPEDLEPLVQHFLGRVDNPRFPGREATLAPEVLSRLRGQPWPGNIRELRNAVERAVSLADEPHLGVADFFPAAGGRAPTTPERLPPAVDTGQPFKEAKAQVVDAWESRYLRALIAEHEGNVSAASRASGITRYHLRELLKKHGLGRTRSD